MEPVDRGSNTRREAQARLLAKAERLLSHEDADVRSVAGYAALLLRLRVKGWLDVEPLRWPSGR